MLRFLFWIDRRRKFKTYAALIRTISRECSEEQAAKCGYDLMMGLQEGDVEKRAEAWKGYYEECRNKRVNDVRNHTQP